MTSQFDDLMYIYHVSKENKRFKPLADFIADLAVQDANTRKKGWNLETWTASKRGETIKALYGEDALKWEFLDDCHDVLDHGEWHLSVFKRNTAFLITAIHDLLNGRELWIRGLKQATKPHYDKFISLLNECGAETTKYTIKLTGVEWH